MSPTKTTQRRRAPGKYRITIPLWLFALMAIPTGGVIFLSTLATLFILMGWTGGPYW